MPCSRLNLLSILEILDMDQSVEDIPALVLGSENSYSVVSYEELKKPFSKVLEFYRLVRTFFLTSNQGEG